MNWPWPTATLSSANAAVGVGDLGGEGSVGLGPPCRQGHRAVLVHVGHLDRHGLRAHLHRLVGGLHLHGVGVGSARRAAPLGVLEVGGRLEAKHAVLDREVAGVDTTQRPLDGCPLRVLRRERRYRARSPSRRIRWSPAPRPVRRTAGTATRRPRPRQPPSRLESAARAYREGRGRTVGRGVVGVRGGGPAVNQPLPGRFGEGLLVAEPVAHYYMWRGGGGVRCAQSCAAE